MTLSCSRIHCEPIVAARYEASPIVPNASGSASRGQRFVFYPDAPRENCQVREGERNCNMPGAENQGETGDFHGDDCVIRVAHQPVGAARRQGPPRHCNDPCCPEGAEARDNPDAPCLKQAKQAK